MGKGGERKDGKKMSGFTLIELMVAMVLTVIVSTAIYMAYNSQHKSYTVQEQVSAMQQNLRSAMYFMKSDIRMAGCDPATKPGGARRAGAEIVTANVGQLVFTMDIGGGENDGIDNDHDSLIDEPGEWYNGTLKGDSGERINFRLDNDGNLDGIADSFPCNLGRETWSSSEGPPQYSTGPSGSSGLQDIAENIEVLNFVYLDGGSPPAVTAVINDIRQIIVTLIARSDREDPEFTNNTVYEITLPNTATLTILPAQGDHFRRSMLSSTITLRNIIVK